MKKSERAIRAIQLAFKRGTSASKIDLFNKAQRMSLEVVEVGKVPLNEREYLVIIVFIVLLRYNAFLQWEVTYKTLWNPVK